MDVLPAIDVTYRPWGVLLSFFIASFASYVAMDLAQRVRTPDRTLAIVWWLGGSVAMGTGIWAMHFVGMLSVTLPFAVGYGYGVTALSWVAAAGVSAVALHLASRRHLTLRSLTTGALVMGTGICVMHYTGMAALDLAPGIRWDPLLVAASGAIAVFASAAALLIFFWLRQASGAARLWQLLAALVMGGAICGMHYTGMAAASFALDSVCLSAGQLSGDSLGMLVAVATSGLLTVTLITAWIDTRMQGRAATLAASLQSANSELQQVAFRDALTGLPNRQLFDDRVGSAVERCARDGSALAMLFVDIDGFKPVNDSFGRGVGDGVLRETARRLAAQARATDTVARLGGDEFVLLLEGRPDTTAAALQAQLIIDALMAPIHESGQELRLSCSVGIAMYPSNGPREHLMAHADAAMAAAKRAGGAAYAFFEPHMNADAREQLDLQKELRCAIERGGELLLHYQPKVDAAGLLITGAEALVRWQHPQRGLLGPGLFIPVAERFGLIGALGNWVIEEACRQVRAWLDEGLRIRVSINLSVHQLRQDDLVARVTRAIAHHRLDASLLTVEITESVAMEDAAGTLRAFEGLRAAGVKLSIDDFGTGYSSLSYLRRLKASELKIDRSFVQDLATSEDARAIVEAVARLAHALGLRVVAEGVETSAQQEVLKHLRCDELQGYLFARPMAPEVLARWADDVDRPSNLGFSESAFVVA